MADRKDVIVYADGGDMTVGRTIPVYVLGAFDVVLPEGREQEKGDDRVRNGYIYRPPTPAAGSLDVGFVKADVKLDFGAKTSSLERVVDAAIRRTEGDVFFERDICQSGLGGFIPGRDFDLHDVIQVDVWGKLLPSPVTAIDYEGSVSQRHLAARVHVGGQMITDAQALQAKTDAVLERVEAEKRQRLKSIGAVSQQAASAGKAAAKADGKAVAAQETADDALAKWRQQKDQLDTFQTRQINELAAQNEALRRVSQLQQPISGTISTYDPLILGPVTVKYPKRNQISFELTDTEHLSGVSVIMNARVDALAQYSYSVTVILTPAQRDFVGSVGWAENYVSASILVIPTADFSAILTEERRKRGLY